MLKIVLYIIEAVLLVILVCAAGLGLFLVASFVVYQVWGPEWLRVNALLVFLLGGLLLAIGLTKLLEIVQYELLHIQGAEIEARLMQDEKAAELFEHLRVK